MKNLILLSSLIFASAAIAHDSSDRIVSEKTVLKCGKEGCSVVCKESGARWDTFLSSLDKLEITYFYQSGTRQYKAKDENGEYTLMDINPAYQSCRITGVKE